MPRNTSSNTRASVAKKTQPKTTAKSDEPKITYESNNDAKSDAEQSVVSKPVYTVKEEPLDPNMFVPVRNGFNGKLIYISRKTGERFVWQKFGDEQDMELRELRAAKTSYKSFFENNWFLIDDPAVISYLGVDRFYENALRYDNFDSIFSMKPEEIEEKIGLLSNGQKSSVAYRARQLVREGEIDSIKVINVLEKSLGIELIEK